MIATQEKSCLHKMINIIEYIKYMIQDEYITEMATIANDIPLDGKRRYRIAIHGASSKDRPYPHIHIYDFLDKSLKKFNFEISLIDILTDDEINLVKQIDVKNGVKHTNRNKCNWNGYTKLKNEFEDWLFEKPKNLPGDFIDNLDAIIWYCNHESESYDKDNYVLKYITDRGKTILSKYKKYFN